MPKRKPKKTTKPIRVDVAPCDILRMYCEQFPDALTRYQQGKRSNDTALDSLRGWLDIQQRVGGADDHVAEFRRRFELAQAGYVRAVEWLTTVIVTIRKHAVVLGLPTDTTPLRDVLHTLPDETSEQAEAARRTVLDLTDDLSMSALKEQSPDGGTGEGEEDREFCLDEDDLEILHTINKHPREHGIAIQRKGINAITEISEKKITGVIKNKLVRLRLVMHPEGKKRGWVTRERGKRYCAEHPKM